MLDFPDYVCPYQGRLLAGVDEVGRGPLAGPVVAAAVILDPDKPIEGLADSKKLSEKRRMALYSQIKERAIGWSVARASVEEIDQLNILHASMLAMKRALETLSIVPEFAVIDGNRIPDISIPADSIVKGDARIACISAASILAKVDRDQEMIALDKHYPEYGFASHKGYPTKSHLRAIECHGVQDFYRQSFAPVKRILAKK
jgi:ribonuclease HII